MLKAVRFRSLIRTGDRIGQRQASMLFGDRRTLELKEIYYRHLVLLSHKAGTTTPPKNKRFDWAFEHQINLGLVAAHMGQTGCLYEMVCGAAIPSLIFSKLTGREIHIIDANPSIVSEIEEFAAGLRIANLHAHVGDCVSFFSPTTLNPGDIVLASNPVNGVAGVWLNIARESPASMLLNIYLDRLGAPNEMFDELPELELAMKTALGPHLDLDGFHEFLVAQPPYPHCQVVCVGKK